MGKESSKYQLDRGVFPLSEFVDRSAADFGDSVVMRTYVGDDKYNEITYNQFRDKAYAIAKWLIDYGIEQGDRIAVLGENSPDWSACYLAVQMAGGVIVPVDRLMPATGIRHIISNSQSRVLFVSDKYLSTVEEFRPVSTLEKKICFVKMNQGEDFDLPGIIEHGKNLNVEFPKRSLDETAAILYTSGTTGHSKGVMLTQNNIASNVAASSQVLALGPDDVFLSVLPVHHSFECTAGFLLPFYVGASITYSRSLKSADIIGDIRNTGVTIMVGVPLLFEKIQQGIQRKLRQTGKEKLVNTMMGIVGVGEKLHLNLSKPLFKGLREKAGMNTIRIFVSGGGPLDPSTAYFFNRLGLKLFQGYGLTETSPVTHVNCPWRVRHETVGPPLPGVEHKILDANDQGVGEICVKGPNIFQGYFQNEEATAEVLDSEGWFKTGDMGLIHKDNYLQITGRKKNMLVTGGGKNVYPEEIEHFLNRSRFIAESLILGAPRAKGLGDEVVALIYPDYEQVDIHFEEMEKKVTDEDVHSLIKEEINEAQKNLADYKRIKRFRIMEEEFQKTSTRKIKRYLYNSEMVTMNNNGGGL